MWRTGDSKQQEVRQKVVYREMTMWNKALGLLVFAALVTGFIVVSSRR